MSPGSGPIDPGRLSSRGAAAVPVTIAVDLGTSGVRSLAYTEDYRVVASSERELMTQVDEDGRSTQTWGEVLSQTKATIAEVAQSPGLTVLALVLSGTASSLAVSRRSAGAERGRSVGDVLLWSDSRAAAFAGEPNEVAAAVDRFPRTLCPNHASYWPAKLRWLKATNAVARATDAAFAGAKDYVFEMLTGRWWVDPMTAASTGIFDSEHWRWDRPSLHAIGLRADQFPEVHAATDCAPLCGPIAQQVGLSEGTPVVVGGMDGPLAQIGAARFATDVHTLTIGTSIAYRAASAQRSIDPTRRIWCYPVTPGFWVAGGAGSNGGNVLAWLSAMLRRPEALPEVVAAAFQVPSDPDLLFLPYLNGERAPLWREDLRGAILGLAAHHGADDIARAGLDGVGAVAIELSSAVADVMGLPNEVRLTGGFLRQSAWVQLVTDALGVPTAVPEPPTATATGAAVIGWLAVGAPVPRAPLPATATHTRQPNPQAHAFLADKARRMGQARRALLRTADRL